MVEEEAEGKGEIRSNRFPEQLQITDKLTFGKLNDFYFFLSMAGNVIYLTMGCSET